MKRYWRWYNNLVEPGRFLMAMLMVSPVICSSLIAEAFDASKPLVFLVCVLLVIGLAISREISTPVFFKKSKHNG
jgi:low temperature requirement protein LtrA